MTSETELLARARAWIDAAQRVVVLTGAGISTDSGIPDFRGQQGAWTKDPAAEARSTLQPRPPCARRTRTARQAARADHAEHR